MREADFHICYFLSSSSQASPKYILIHPLLVQLFSISFVSIETGSCPMYSSLMAASFIIGQAPAGVSLLVKKQLHPQLPMSNGNFLTAEIYLSHTGGNGMQLCIALLAVHTGLLPTEGVSDMWINKDKLTRLLRWLCGGGGRPLSIWNIAEAAIYCFIFKGIRPLQIKAFKILLDRNLKITLKLRVITARFLSFC